MRIAFWSGHGRLRVADRDRVAEPGSDGGLPRWLLYEIVIGFGFALKIFIWISSSAVLEEVDKG